MPYTFHICCVEAKGLSSFCGTHSMEIYGAVFGGAICQSTIGFDGGSLKLRGLPSKILEKIILSKAVEVS